MKQSLDSKMNKIQTLYCAYCREQIVEAVLSGQRCISKNSVELYPYQICQACYSILNQANYLKNAEKIKNKQIFWDKVNKNLRKRRREAINKASK